MKWQQYVFTVQHKYMYVCVRVLLFYVTSCLSRITLHFITVTSQLLRTPLVISSVCNFGDAALGESINIYIHMYCMYMHVSRLF